MNQISVDSAKRQIEINEWEYSHKLEALFISQLMFIGLMMICVLVVLSKYGIFKPGFVLYVSIFIIIILIIVWFIRFMYTGKIRNNRFWMRRDFAGDKALGSNIPPNILAASATQANEMCNAVQTPPEINCPPTTPVATS
jgi:hypothetical protein